MHSAEDDMLKYELCIDRGAMKFFAVYVARGKKNQQACICAPYDPSTTRATRNDLMLAWSIMSCSSRKV